MLVAIKKFKESDDNEYVRITKLPLIKKYKGLIKNQSLKNICFDIGAKNGSKRDKNFEIVEARSHSEPYRGI